MKTSFVIVGFFILGVLSGYSDLVPQVLGSTDISMYVLFLLMILVGMSIGSDRKLKEILKTLQPKILLIPAATITGTLAASALISLAIARWGMTECLAAGSGMGYYSLSSILITDLKEASLGAATGGFAGDDRPDEQHPERTFYFTVGSSVGAVFRSVGPHLCGRRHHDGFDPAGDHGLQWETMDVHRDRPPG